MPKKKLDEGEEEAEEGFVGVVKGVKRLVDTWPRFLLSLRVWLVWFAGMVVYYGLVFMLPRITSHSTSAPTPGPFIAPTPFQTPSFEYSSILVASTGEIVAVFVSSFLIEKSRIRLTGGSFLLYAVLAGAALPLFSQFKLFASGRWLCAHVIRNPRFS